MRVRFGFLLGALAACAAPSTSSSLEGDKASGTSRAGERLGWLEYWAIGRTIGDDRWTGPSVHEAEFVLHDTGGNTRTGYMMDREAKGRGPLGSGPQLWVNHEGIWGVRPFFNRWRPTSTKREQARDLIPDRSEFDEMARQLWRSASSEVQDQALQNLFEPLRESTRDDILSDAEMQAERDAARSQLNASSGNLYTSATWAVEAVLAAGTGGAPTGDETALRDYFNARNGRVERSVHVEMGQPRGGCEGGSVVPYTDSVYANIAREYLKAAHRSGMYPTITTHFVADAEFQGHCDPRCFNLGRLYSEIATLLGHAEGTTYGVEPTYGKTWGQYNVWWSNDTCGGPPPG